MKLFLLVLIFPLFLFGCGRVTEAQSTTANASGNVTNKNPTDPQTKKTVTDISKTDFKNFTYPIPNVANLDRTFTLKNGLSVKKGNLPVFSLRKTYYFDVTGDRQDEAITHIIANGCQLGCESSSLFYIHTTENNQPKLIWKIAIGGDVMGGLKSAHFKVKEFVIETFGDCTVDDWLIKTNLDMDKNPYVKTTSYSRFQFTYENGSFALGPKTVLPLNTNLNPAGYRPQITFGDGD